MKIITGLGRHTWSYDQNKTPHTGWSNSEIFLFFFSLPVPEVRIKVSVAGFSWA